MRQSSLPLSLILFAAACDAASSPEAVQRAEPIAIGKGDGGDQADRSCQVVLRSLARTPEGGDFATACDGSGCDYLWRAEIDVDAALPADATVAVMIRREGDAQWWQAEAVADAGAAPGYRRHAVTIGEHLWGPDEAPVAIEAVALVQLPGGGRLFDHNRFADPFTNHVLDGDNAFASHDGGVCAPVVGSLAFGGDWSEGEYGVRRQGGWLQVSYALERLGECRGTHNGYPAWDIVGHARFEPGGQTVSGSVRELLTDQGVPNGQANPRPWLVEIPDDAESVALWFHNFSGAGSSCEAWDSDFGQNYRWSVWPAADDPRCRDVERETGVHGESELMVHAAPHCLDYDVDAEHDANHCELWVEGFGDGFVGHYGIPYRWLVAFVRTGAVDGEVLGVGTYSRFHDAEGVPGERFSLGRGVAPGVWQTGFAYEVVSYGGPGVDVTVDEVAFFVDVRRSGGQIERLWRSRGGANYPVADALAEPGAQQAIPYGTMRWAADGSPIYDGRAACG